MIFILNKFITSFKMYVVFDLNWDSLHNFYKQLYSIILWPLFFPTW